MNKDDLIKLCLFCEDAAVTYPFKEKKYDDMPVIRHKSNGKWFALIYELNGRLCVNLKCNPLDATLLREQYSFVMPAWHMNKTHWNKVDVKQSPLDLLKRMIRVSFDLTVK